MFMKLKSVKIISKWKVSVETDDVVIDVILKKNIDDQSKNNLNKYLFFMNGIKKDFEKQQKQEIINHIINNIDKHELEYVIANDDYNNIYNIYSFDEIKTYFNNDYNLMKQTLTNVLNIFIEQEQYEKCIIINNLLNKIK